MQSQSDGSFWPAAATCARVSIDRGWLYCGMHLHRWLRESILHSSGFQGSIDVKCHQQHWALLDALNMNHYNIEAWLTLPGTKGKTAPTTPIAAYNSHGLHMCSIFPGPIFAVYQFKFLTSKNISKPLRDPPLPSVAFIDPEVPLLQRWWIFMSWWN